jgi:cytochrome P450
MGRFLQAGQTGPPRGQGFALGAGITLEQLDADPHPALAQLRSHEPVSWLPSLDGWLITRHDLAVAAMRDWRHFTVDDPRFSTAQVVGPSMLSLDGDEHARHRAPFISPFRAAEVSQRFAEVARAEARRLVDALEPVGAGELRRAFAGPMSAAIVTRALGLAREEVDDVLGWYDAIVASVTAITAGRGQTAEGERAFAALRERLRAVIGAGDRASLLAAAAGGGGLSADQVVSNAAVLLFGGIETTEGMIANAALALLEHPAELARVRADPEGLDAAIDESLRLEPAAAVVDRYATADMEFGGAPVRHGDLVRISITAANRDPEVFPAPDDYIPSRPRRGNLAFAQGAHVCVGVHLARLEARAALDELLNRMPRLRLDPERPAAIRGLVFRKPPRLDVLWT